MPDSAAHAIVRASTTAGPAEVLVAVAAVLSRLAGTDRVTLSLEPPTATTIGAGAGVGVGVGVGVGAWPREMVLRRTSCPRDVLAALSLTPTTPPDLPPAGVTVSAIDPAGRRHTARVYGDGGSTAWAWLTDPGADPAADDRVRRVLAEPDAALSAVVLTDAERAGHAALATSSVTGPGLNVVSELARHALAHPNRPAIVDADGPLTYTELDRATADWATRVAGLGARPATWSR